MAVEQRRNGNLYYYRKRREGDRVVSEYVGGGALVHLADYQDKQERLRREAGELRDRRAQMSVEEIDRQLDEYSEMVDLLATAELLTRGYHRHNRQWRRRR